MKLGKTVELSHEHIENITSSIKHIYICYALLALANKQNQWIKINGQNQSIQDYLLSMIEQATNTSISTELDINGIKYLLNFSQQDNHWLVDFELSADVEFAMKKIHEYSPADWILFTKKYPIKLELDIKTQIYTLSVSHVLSEQNIITFGGPGKIKLYDIHLNNLYNMFLSVQANQANLLVTMATGSGKSFTQALWFLVMFISGYNCIFSVPREDLKLQLKNDFSRLIPNNILDVITFDPFLPKHENGVVTEGFYRILKHDELLNIYWGQIIKSRMSDYLDQKITFKQFEHRSSISYEKLYILFDEEHELMKHFLFKSRIKELAKYHPLMFLSATPSDIAYKLCQEQAVADCSRHEKIKQFNGQSIRSDVVSASPITSTSFSLFDRFKSEFVDILEKKRISCVHNYIHKSELAIFYRDAQNEFYVNPLSALEGLRQFARWNINCPVGEKALILTDHTNPLINLNLVLNGELECPYQNGNRVERGVIFSLFQLGRNLDISNLQDYRKEKVKQRQQAMLQYLQKNHMSLAKNLIHTFLEENIDFSETHDYLRYRIYHGIIELTLNYLTGFENQQLNKIRREDLMSLVEIVRSDLNRKHNLEPHEEQYDLNVITEYLVNYKSIMLIWAQKIAPLIYAVLCTLKKVEHQALESMIIDNWAMDKILHQKFDGLPRLREWANKYKTVYAVYDLVGSGVQINYHRPFLKLKEHKSSLQQILASGKQIHKSSPLETLNPDTVLHHYETDDDSDITSIAESDALFKLGLIGAYVTSERISGFNDTNLHHVALLLSTHDKFNSPEHIIQASGRLRGLDPAHYPYFILAEDEGVSHTFSPDILDKKDYINDLISARKKSTLQLAKQMAEQISEEIEKIVNSLIDPNGWLDPLVLENKINELFLNNFEILYNENNHDSENARIKFIKVLEDVDKALQNMAKTIKKRYSLSLSQQGIAYQLDCLVNSQYYTVTSTLRAQLDDLLGIEPPESVQRVYAKIIKSFDFRTTTMHFSSSKQMLKVMGNELQRTWKFLSENPSYILSDANNQLVRDGFVNLVASKILPVLRSPLLQKNILQLIEESELDWPIYLSNHMDLFEKIDNSNDPSIERKVINFFKIIKQDKKIADIIPKILPSFESCSYTLKGKILSCRVAQWENSLAEHHGNIQKPSDQIASELIQKLIKDGSIIFLLDTYLSLFLLEQVDHLKYTEVQFEDLIKYLSEEKIEEAIEILCQGVPSSMTPQIPVFDKSREANLIRDLTILKENPEDAIDESKLHSLCCHSLERFISSDQYHKLFNEIFQKLTPNDLAFLLSYIYIHEPDKTILKKEALIHGFLVDLALLSSKEILEKYAVLPLGTKDYLGTDLFEAHKILLDVVDEILVSICYYLGVTRNGDPVQREQILTPKLMVVNPSHAIWTIHHDDIGITVSDELSWKQKQIKMQPLFGTLDTFQAINEIEYLKDLKIYENIKFISTNMVQSVKQMITKKIDLYIHGFSFILYKGPSCYYKPETASPLVKKILFFPSYHEEKIKYKASAEPNVFAEIRRDMFL